MIIDYNQPLKQMPLNRTPVRNLSRQDRLFLAPLEDSIALLERQREFKLDFITRCEKIAEKALGNISLSALEVMTIGASLSIIHLGNPDQLETNKRIPLLLHPDDQQKAFYWTYTLDRDDKNGIYSCDMKLLRLNANDIRDISCWDEALESWTEIAPSEAYLFDPALNDIFGEDSPRAALLHAVILAYDYSFLTLEDWNVITLENHLLLKLAEELPVNQRFFSKTPNGEYALLPVKDNLTGFGIRQDGDSLMLLQFLPSNYYFRVMDDVDVPSPVMSYAYDIETVSSKEALKLLMAAKYKTDPDPENVSLLLPLSKDRLLFRKELPSQSDPAILLRNIRYNNLTKKEKENLDHFTDLLAPKRRAGLNALKSILGLSDEDFPF